MALATNALRVAVASTLGYLLGTFPTADIVAAQAGDGDVDLRDEGSGNPGTTNALNVLGPAAGAAVLVGDIGKGALACGLGRAIGGPAGAHLAGVAAVAGHCYPVWNGFRGGKGVATSVGQCLITFPAYFPIDVTVAVGTVVLPGLKRRAFAATAVSSLCWIVGGAVWWRRGWRNGWGPRPSALLPAAAALTSAMIVQRFVASDSEGPASELQGPAVEAAHAAGVAR